MMGWDFEGSEKSTAYVKASKGGQRGAAIFTLKMALGMIFDPRLLWPFNWRAIPAVFALAWTLLTVTFVLLMPRRKHETD